MDKFLQTVEVTRDRYQAVALTCLVLAAKYEEKEISVPSLRRLREYVEKRLGENPARQCEANVINNMEVLILNTLGWKITIVTPLHYLGIFERVVRSLSASAPTPSHAGLPNTHTPNPTTHTHTHTHILHSPPTPFAHTH